jgi:hypothetical protein
MSERSLGVVLHGFSGSGKSWLGATTPAIRLICDSEGGSRFTPGVKVHWDGVSAPPPAPGVPVPAAVLDAQGRILVASGVTLPKGMQLWDGPEGPSMPYYDTVIVIIRNFQTLESVYRWLNSGQHVFRSVVIDSLTEVQKRLQDAIAGTEQMKQQDWGALLRRMESLVREMRDLTFHPTNPLEAVVLLAITSNKDGKQKPHVQGQLNVSLPYFMDVVGYVFAENDPATGQRLHRILVQPTAEYEAKDRTNLLPAIVDIGDLNGYDGSANYRVGVTAMLDTIYGPPPAAAGV